MPAKYPPPFTHPAYTTPPHGILIIHQKTPTGPEPAGCTRRAGLAVGRCLPLRHGHTYALPVIAAVVLFAVVGVVMTTVQVIRRRWLDALQAVMGVVVVELAYAGIILRQHWIGLVALGITVVTAIVFLVMKQRAKRDRRRNRAETPAPEHPHTALAG